MKDRYRSEYEKKFTKPDDAKKKINLLKKLDLSKISDFELQNLINSYFNIIPFTSGKNFRWYIII